MAQGNVLTPNGIVQMEIPDPVVIPDEVTERNWRNEELQKEVDPHAHSVLIWNDLTAAEQTAVTNYRRSLLDWPQQTEFPDAAQRPEKPAGYPVLV
jgi:hypothetical protein